MHEEVSIVVEKSIELLSDDVQEGHAHIAADQVNVLRETPYEKLILHFLILLLYF